MAKKLQIISYKTNSISTGLARSGCTASCKAVETDAVFSSISQAVTRSHTSGHVFGGIPKDLVTDAASINIGSISIIIKNGVLYKDYNNLTDTGTIIGSISTEGEIILLSNFANDVPNTVVLKSVVTQFSRQYVMNCVFRTQGAPVRPGSFYVQAEKPDGTVINATADLAGEFSSAEISGTINYETGIVELEFGRRVSPAADFVNEYWYAPENVVDGSIWMPVPVIADTVKYNCVVYSYIPLDADLVGLDPVRLPQDGRVPIFRKGDVVVVHHTLTTRLPAGLTAGQQISLPRGDLDVVELYAGDGLYVPSTQYSVNMASGVITMADPLDLTGYPQPLTALHRREEMKLLSDVQINGSLTVTHAFEREYPANGTRVSGALTFGDLQSRVKNVFDQKTWGNVWSDTRTGDAATATYNTLNYPIVTTNRGAIPQRWALVFWSSTQFFIMGEQLGVIGEGYINQDCHPINPATNTPYFTVKLEGWGSNWAAGNVLRFETMAAGAPVWFSRVTLQGPVTEPDDQFTIHVRGDGN